MSNLVRHFRKSLEKRIRRGFHGYPVATIAYYGPDEKRASKVVVGIIRGQGQDVAMLKRWHSEHGDVRSDLCVAVQRS